MILAIDQGTTGTTCLVFDERGAPGRARVPRVRAALPAARLGRARRRTRSGRSRARSPARRSRPPASRAADLRGDRHHEPARDRRRWDRRTGEPLHRAIVWQDRRTAARCDAAAAEGREELVRERTGLVIDPYFSGTKIEWLLAERRRASDGRRGDVLLRHDRRLARLQADRPGGDRLLERVADAAVRHPPRCDWDAELCELLGVPAEALPEAVPLGAALRRDRRRTPSSAPRVPLAGIAGDQQAALFGQACHSAGLGKNTYGTGSFVLLNTGAEPRRRASPGLLTHGRLGPRRPHRLRARGERLRDRAPPSSGCATASGSSPAAARPRRWPRRSTPTTASTSCRR